MSFSPQIYRQKLEALQDTQESIVSISQWLLFHYRHCQELCDLWAEYTLSNESSMNPKKRLALFYLCNDVVQQARHKRRPQFTECFAKSLPAILHKVYPNMRNDLQSKVERLIAVWEQRSIFDKSDIEKMKRAIETLKKGEGYNDKSDTAMKKTQTQAQIAPDLIHLNDLYNHLSKVLDSSSSNLAQVGAQCKLYLPQNPETQDDLPLPNVYITKLNVLEKLCNMTKGNLQEATSVKKNIVNVLATLSSLLTDQLTSDETKTKIIDQRLARLETTRAELREIIGTEENNFPDDSHSQPIDSVEDKKPTPAFEVISETDDTVVPTYENNSDSDVEIRSDTSFKKRRVTENYSNSPSSTSSSNLACKTSKKSVAFSEDVQVKEFVREEQAEVVEIIRSENSSDDEKFEEDDEENYKFNEKKLKQFEKEHKNDIELRDEHLRKFKSDNYDPSINDTHGYNGKDEDNDNFEESQSGSNTGLLSLLSKLN